VRVPGPSRKLFEDTSRERGTRFRGFVCAGASDSAHGGVRTSLLSLVTLIALAAVVIIVLARNLGPPEQASPPSVQSSARDIQRAPASDGPEITGTITVAPDLMGRVQDASVLLSSPTTPLAPLCRKAIVSPLFPWPIASGRRTS